MIGTLVLIKKFKQLMGIWLLKGKKWNYNVNNCFIEFIMDFIQFFIMDLKNWWTKNKGSPNETKCLLKKHGSKSQHYEAQKFDVVTFVQYVPTSLLCMLKFCQILENENFLRCKHNKKEAHGVCTMLKIIILYFWKITKGA